ncbi:MAG TPA: hypothetical protein VLH15_06940 [Dehalococcoidales bacterium]|nr:hypothetical protein [Dehalococcoidales bacterium]
MKRGCISLGNINCDECHRNIPYPERYLSIEIDKLTNQTLCLNCCIDKNLTRKESEKPGAEILFDLSKE